MSRRVTALNNTGIQSLQSGCFSEAILSFRHAIQCIKSCTDDYHHLADDEQAVELPVRPVASNNCLDSRMILECSPHNTFDIYQTAFEFPRVECLASYQVEISTVLFYNLAVAHHFSGLSGSAEQSNYHLNEALRFYKLALTVFKSTPTVNFDESCLPLVLGTLNNLGYLFDHFWSTDEATACKRHLKETLHSSSSMEALLEEDEDFFFSAASCAHSIALLAPAA